VSWLDTFDCKQFMERGCTPVISSHMTGCVYLMLLLCTSANIPKIVLEIVGCTDVLNFVNLQLYSDINAIQNRIFY